MKAMLTQCTWNQETMELSAPREVSSEERG